MPPFCYARLMNLLKSAINLLSITTLLSCTDQLPEPPTPGVAAALAQQRAQAVANVVYDLKLQVPASASEALRGELTVRLGNKKAAAPFEITA